MSAQVARVEQTAAFRLHQKRVGIERAVVDKVGGNAKWPELEWRQVDQVVRRERQGGPAGEEGGFLEDPLRGFTDETRNSSGDLRKQAIVVRMRIRNDHSEQTWIAFIQTRDLR